MSLQITRKQRVSMRPKPWNVEVTLTTRLLSLLSAQKRMQRMPSRILANMAAAHRDEAHDHHDWRQSKCKTKAAHGCAICGSTGQNAAPQRGTPTPVGSHSEQSASTKSTPVDLECYHSLPESSLIMNRTSQHERSGSVMDQGKRCAESTMSTHLGKHSETSAVQPWRFPNLGCTRDCLQLFGHCETFILATRLRTPRPVEICLSLTSEKNAKNSKTKRLSCGEIGFPFSCFN